MSAKDENIKVHCTPCAGDKEQSSLKNKTSNFKVPAGGVQHRAVSKATASTSAGGPPPPKQQKLDLGVKQVSVGELKKLVGQYVVEEMLHLNMVDSPSFGAIINKIPTAINAVLSVTVKNTLLIK